MQHTRVHNLRVSLDGFAAGDHVTLETPFGGAEALVSHFDPAYLHGVDFDEAPATLDRVLTGMWGQRIGAEIMGRKKFGPQAGPWPDDGWGGWWGDEPPFRTPTFVLTHHAHPPLEFANGTSFHFIDAEPAEALRIAQEAANGLDVRIGGGPSTVRQFLEADLIDFLHVVIVPITLGGGVSPWEGLEGLQQRFTVESFASASGLLHQLWNHVDRE